MQLRARPYRDPTDLARMRQLLMAGIRANRRANLRAHYMPLGFLDWETHFPPDEQANRRDLRLWARAEEGSSTLEAFALEAFALYSRHEETFDLFVTPELYGTPAHEALVAEYLAWAEGRAREAGLKQLSPFWLQEDDEVMCRLLAAHGFVTLPGLPPPLFERSLDELPTIPLPHGFTVQGVGSLDDGRLRAAVTHAAFRPTDDWEAYWDTYAQFIGSAVYDGERDLFVRSPDGRGASACTIWFDPVNQVGLFEPVATHPDFQRQGLGKAVMAEGLRRMKAAGMRQAILGFDPNNTAARALYQYLGFGATCYFRMCRKEI